MAPCMHRPSLHSAFSMATPFMWSRKKTRQQICTFLWEKFTKIRILKLQFNRSKDSIAKKTVFLSIYNVAGSRT